MCKGRHNNSNTTVLQKPEATLSSASTSQAARSASSRYSEHQSHHVADTNASLTTAYPADLSPKDEPEALYAEFQPLVNRLIRQYGETAEMRHDLKGEIYFRFCALVAAYDPNRGVPLRPYLVRQLTASVYTYARHQWTYQNREISLEHFAGEREARQSNDPTQEWDQALNLQSVGKTLAGAIRELPERQRKVVIWRYYDNRSFEEIAETLGIQTSTARSLLRHGITRLKETIRQSPLVAAEV